MRGRFFPRATIALVAVVTLVGLVTGFNPAWLWVDWPATDKVPFAVSRQLEIATRWKPLKRSSLSLLCGPRGAHLMIKSRLPYPDEYRPESPQEKGFAAHSELIFDTVPVKKGVFIHSFETRSAILDFGTVDTVLTDALTADQRAMLLNWFERGAPRGVSFGMMETISTLSGTAAPNEVSAFFARCPSTLP